MPRRGFIAKRDVLPDPIYNSKVVTKLVNNIMLDGKKSVAINPLLGTILHSFSIGLFPLFVILKEVSKLLWKDFSFPYSALYSILNLSTLIYQELQALLSFSYTSILLIIF